MHPRCEAESDGELDWNSAEGNMDRPVDPEDQGVAVALEKICSLESRLRQAIQSTHTLHRSFGRDMGAVDREREALLLIRENLELLEDKLREYRAMAMDPKSYDDKVVALSQLDGLRKDLLRCARDRVDFVLYNKDVVKDILAFSDTGASDEVLHDAPSEPEGYATRGMYSGPGTPHSSDGEESYSEDEYRDYREPASYIPSSRGPSPYASQEQLSLMVPTRDDFLHPAPATTPSIRAASSQASRDYHRGPPEVGVNSIPNLRSSSVDFRGSQNLRFDPLANPAGSQNHGGAIAPRRASKKAVSRSLGEPAASPQPLHVRVGGRHYDQAEADENADVIQPRVNKRRPQRPPSFVSSNETPARHEELSENLPPIGVERQQPSFGGKLSFGKRGDSSVSASVSAPSVPLPPTPGPADRPRVISTSSFSSDDQIRPVKRRTHEEEPVTPAYSDSLIQPSRHASSLRNQLTTALPPRKRRGILHRARGFVSQFAALGDFVKGAFSGAVGLGAVFVILQAIGRSGLYFQVPLLAGRKKNKARRGPSLDDLWKLPSVPKLPSRSSSKKQEGKPRSDGHLVPEWMHHTSFSATEQPPIGALTSTPRPPAGEMFPVMPPPTSKHTKG